MAFNRDTEYLKKERNNNFKRNDNIAKSVREAETKNIKEEQAETRAVSASTKQRKEGYRVRKEYMMLNFYPEEKRKLKRLANQRGVSASQYIENLLAKQNDPGPEWD